MVALWLYRHIVNLAHCPLFSGTFLKADCLEGVKEGTVRLSLFQSVEMKGVNIGQQGNLDHCCPGQLIAFLLVV